LGVDAHRSHVRSGLLYAVTAYGWWGLVPLYFYAVKACPAQELVAHRILWSALLLAVVVSVFHRWPEVVTAIHTRKTVLMLFASAYLVAGNWYLYVWCATHEHIMEASLGYFILPLVNVIAGLMLFGDRLRWAQAAALLIATAGVVYMAVSVGEFPWIGIVLAVSFALYGIVRKVVPVDGVIGLTVESFLLAPVAGWLLVYWELNGGLAFGHTSRQLDWLIALSGVVTTVPLVCFAQAVRKVSLVTIGVLQYLSPTLQLVVAVTAFGERFGRDHQVSFGLIWLGLAIYAVDTVRAAARKHLEGPAPEPVPEPIDGGVPLTDSQLLDVRSPPRRGPGATR
jgi:chloramphenicol-sensitive protein RarD